jgi:RNA polymerase sigma-70 factor (ECF subfamily)
MTLDSTTLSLATATHVGAAGCEVPQASALTDLRAAGHPLGMCDSAASVGEIYRRHAPSVYRRALRILGSEAGARAVLQELFVSLFELAELHGVGQSLSSYLYGATTHACLTRLRAQRSSSLAPARESDLSVVAVGSPLASLGVLRSTLARLPEPLAVVAVYSVLDGLDEPEMAELLGCSRRQVGQLLTRLRAWGRASAEPACAAE